MTSHPKILATCLEKKHFFSKKPALAIRLVSGMGVEGDAHFGVTTQHRFERRYAPERANLRQVHLIDNALYTELRNLDFDLGPGDLGENLTTCDLNLPQLPRGTILQIGLAWIELTGLRQPCILLDKFRPGLRAAVESVGRGGDTYLRGGVMARVIRDGVIHTGDEITLLYPPKPYLDLKNV